MDSGLLAAIDLYCERTGPGFWSEPLNALSNLAFIAAGLWGVRAVRRGRTGAFAEVLAWWVVAIGVGSGLFHTFANGITAWADVIPIAGFTFAYTLFNLRRFLGLCWTNSLAVFVLFYLIAGALTWLVPDSLRAATNGTLGYLPAFLALVFFGAVELAVGNPAGRYNLAAAAIFVVSAVFRSIDAQLCASVPLGTHFLWHLLNALMLGVMLAAVARYGAPQAVRPARAVSGA